MNKERFIKMLEQAKEDEYGRLYVLGEYSYIEGGNDND